MSSTWIGIWPWFTLAGLGVFHGVNPAMGWLFAVALGLQRRSRTIVLASLLPIAAGHAAAVALALVAAFAAGLVLDGASLGKAAGAALIAWAAWHAWRGHRQRLRVGMQVGLAGLAMWSFLMATAHGAGLMLYPILLPICLSDAPALVQGGSVPNGIAALCVHSTAMLATIGLVSVVVYEWAGLAFLRSHWINLDLVWRAALGLSGAFLLLS
ncbi:hypothetical protein SAMN05519104_7455 [Rhizobiales bacterium GAS188]|nr:hypothetical protein SAMN05519104_7455 [Rhizobiales bacterium GAS188]